MKEVLGKSIGKIELTPSPTAKECRERLKHLEYMEEKRKGYFWIAVLVASVLAFLLCYTTAWVAALWDLPEPFNFLLILLLALIIFPSLIMFVSYEQKLESKNKICHFIDSLSLHLEEGEEILCIFVGKGNSLRLPAWLGDICVYSYFVFTTDRLLIVTFDSKLVGVDQIEKEVEAGRFSFIVKDIFTCSLLNKSSYSFGGLIKNPIFLNFTHTKAVVTPSGQDSSYRWVVDDKMTQSGRVLRKVLESIGSAQSTNV